jgi:hypothetical protein
LYILFVPRSISFSKSLANLLFNTGLADFDFVDVFARVFFFFLLAMFNSIVSGSGDCPDLGTWG